MYFKSLKENLNKTSNIKPLLLPHIRTLKDNNSPFWGSLTTFLTALS